MLNKRILNINGIHTEIYQTKPEPEVKYHIVILPGNPGIALYYQNLTRSISQNTNLSLNISIISYANFTESKPTRLYSIQEEADHKIACLQHLKKESLYDAKFILIGHSIGAWICYKILQVPELYTSIEKAFLLFPFLAQHNKLSQQKYVRLISQNYILSSFTKFCFTCLQTIPANWKKNLLSPILKDFDEESKVHTINFFTKFPHIIKSVLYMAKTEFESLSSDLDLDFIKTKASKLQFIYNETDHWAPLEQANIIKTQIPDAQVEILQGVDHAFCVYEKDSELIGKWIAGYIDNLK
ncbi:MAG: hypothetical protein H7A25_26355 [Leptospiraceae bacterium]|nr:hypothetical protein [Leptospiraceae bacterium]